MIEVFSPCRLTTNDIAKKMLRHIAVSVILLAAAVSALFINISKDSEANRDAVRKVTSGATEICAIITFVVFVLAIVYLSVVGVFYSRNARSRFTKWVYYRGGLYYIHAVVPYSHSNSRMSPIVNVQDNALAVINNDTVLIKLIESDTPHQSIRIIPIEKIDGITEKRHGLEIYSDKLKLKISDNINDFERLSDIIYGLYQNTKAP